MTLKTKSVYAELTAAGQSTDWLPGDFQHMGGSSVAKDFVIAFIDDSASFTGDIILEIAVEHYDATNGTQTFTSNGGVVFENGDVVSKPVSVNSQNKYRLTAAAGFSGTADVVLQSSANANFVA